MALMMMERMKEVRQSEVWAGAGFKESFENVDRKVVIRQGENVRQLRSILRGGLDVSMAGLIQSATADEDAAASLQTELASAFGQG